MHKIFEPCEATLQQCRDLKLGKKYNLPPLASGFGDQYSTSTRNQKVGEGAGQGFNFLEKKNSHIHIDISKTAK